MALQPEEAGRATSVSGDEAGRGRQIRLAAVASVIGTSIEWYDFFLYGTAAAIVFPSVFFPASSAYAGTLESFATYAVGFAARPVGAAIFGHWGDRIGRKATLIITLLMMGIASALVGVLPGTNTGRGRQIRLAAVASVIGTSIEWYDFFLYGTAAAIVFPSVFFPASSAYAGTLESFATYAVGFAARPVGAAIFGHWGDRIGRKATLIITLLMMGIASALVGVLPGTNTIGVAAPILLVVLRLLQGVAVGGEWSGSVLLSMEWGKQNKRGLMASWPQIGVPIGLLLGTGMMTLIALAAPDAFKAWAWRIPFLASLVLVAIGLWVRLKVMETPLFAQLVKKRTVSKVPVLDVIRRYPKQIVLSALLRMSEQAPFYLYTAFALAYSAPCPRSRSSM